MSEESAKHATVFDTEQQQLGDIYAKALLGMSEKTGQTDRIISELTNVVGLLDKLPKLRSVLESPRIGFQEKEKLLDKSLAGKVSKEMLNFLKIVGAKGRFDCLPAISESAQRMHDELANRVRANIITAKAIDDQTRDQVAKRLADVLGKKVEVTTRVDPSIIGGMVVRVDDTVYDGSVVNQLSQFRSQAMKRAGDAIRSSFEKFAVGSNENQFASSVSTPGSGEE